MNNHIRTRSGILFNVFAPKVEEINIEDIAHGLSMECRYGGHCKEFYSVAEHSVLLSYTVQNTLDAKIMLLHDATEAYLGDIPRPLKVSETFAGYRDIENHLYQAIMFVFNLPVEFPAHLKELDSRIISNETEVLFDVFEFDAEPIPGLEINMWDHKTAKNAFLERFKELF